MAPHATLTSPAEPRASAILECWDALVDPRVGIIKEIRPLPTDDDEPDFFHYLSMACDTSAFATLRNYGNNGGVGTTRERAIAKAMGEAIERYCAAIYDERALLTAPFRDLPHRATPPESFALYRQTQFQDDFPWTPFTDTTPTAWVAGRSLLTEEPVFVPAAAVYVPFIYRRARRDEPIMEPISTGLACGPTRDAAVLGGLCEAIERDAFTITWQARLARPRIDRRTLPAELDDMVRRFEDVGLSIEIVDITTDIGCPTMLTVAVGTASTSPAVAVAAACALDPRVALHKSLEELAHTRKYAAQLMDYTPPVAFDIVAGHPGVQDQRHHLRAYCPQDAVAVAEFLWSSDDVRPLRTGGGDVEAVVQMVARAGLEPVVCDLTTPDVAELGLSVVRVVVPGLHPLFMGHQNRALGGRRLLEVPARLGAGGLHADDQDNPYPHPFP